MSELVSTLRLAIKNLRRSLETASSKAHPPSGLERARKESETPQNVAEWVAGESLNLNDDLVDLIEKQNALLIKRFFDLPKNIKTAQQLVLRYQGLRSMRAINKKKAITPAERESVEALNEELKLAFPLNTPRYAEIADRIDMKPGRVRYIVEGHRRHSRAK